MSSNHSTTHERTLSQSCERPRSSRSKTRVIFLASAACLFGFTGCVKPLAPVASHTIRVAENQNRDVVWVDYAGDLMRCTNEATGPMCHPAQKP